MTWLNYEFPFVSVTYILDIVLFRFSPYGRDNVEQELSRSNKYVPTSHLVDCILWPKKQVEPNACVLDIEFA
jgi:hypothetical protein